MMEDMTYGLRFNTRQSLDMLEDWLIGHCLGNWNIKLAGIIEDNHGKLWKRLEILFALPQDRQSFRVNFAGQ